MSVLLFTIALACIIYCIEVVQLQNSFLWLGFAILAMWLNNLWCREDITFHNTMRYVFFGIFIILLACLCIFCRINKTMKIQTKYDADCIIVFGASLEDRKMGGAIDERCEKAFEYLENNRNSIAILSGGLGNSHQLSEAEYMREYLIGKGIEEDRLLLEDQSVSTSENIKNSIKVLKQMRVDVKRERIGIISSDYHLDRIRYLMKKQGVKNLDFAGAKTSSLFLPHFMMREIIMLLPTVCERY